VLAWGCPEGPVAEFPDGDASVVNFEPTEEQLATVSRVPGRQRRSRTSAVRQQAPSAR